MRVKKYLPSLITLTNLFLGFLSILYVQRGELNLSCQLILIAALLDSFDGKLARKIGVSSSFGKEIDSLADVVSFCLAPSFLVFNILYSIDLITLPVSEFLFIYIAIIASFPVLMGAIRLARFNVEHNEENTQESDNLIDEEVNLLEGNTSYCWRVRYRDKGLAWSEWSEIIEFETGPGQGPGE